MYGSLSLIVGDSEAVNNDTLANTHTLLLVFSPSMFRLALYACWLMHHSYQLKVCVSPFLVIFTVYGVNIFVSVIHN